LPLLKFPPSYLKTYTHVNHYISVANQRSWETHHPSANLHLPENTLTSVTFLHQTAQYCHRSYRLFRRVCHTTLETWGCKPEFPRLRFTSRTWRQSHFNI